jgi:hypothetical protein
VSHVLDRVVIVGRVNVLAGSWIAVRLFQLVLADQLAGERGAVAQVVEDDDRGVPEIRQILMKEMKKT